MTYKHCFQCGTPDKDPRFPKCRSCHFADVAEAKARRVERLRRQEADRLRREKDAEAKRIADAAAYAKERETCHICCGKPLGGVPLPADAEEPTFCRNHKHAYSFGRPCNLCGTTVRCVSTYRGIVCYPCDSSTTAAKNHAVWAEENCFGDISEYDKRHVVHGVYMQFSNDGKLVQTHVPKWLVPFVDHTNQVFPTRMFDRDGNTNLHVEGALVSIFTSLYAIGAYVEDDIREMIGPISVIRGIPGRLPLEEMMASA